MVMQLGTTPSANVEINGEVSIETRYILGDFLLYLDDTLYIDEEPTTSYVKQWEKTISTLSPSPTTIRTSFAIRNQFSGKTTSARIYKNGIAFGTARTSGDDQDFDTFEEDLIFEEGDTFEIWVKSSYATSDTELKNIKILGDALTGSVPIDLGDV